MTGGSGARFEFRAWAERLDDVGRRLRALSDPDDTGESTEVYIVSTETVDVNPKVRHGLLDIKVLVAVDADGFEQWAVHNKWTFPVAAGVVRAELCPLLGVAAQGLDRDVYSATHLLDEVVAPHPRLAGVEVVKHRWKFALDACTAELADVVVGGRRLQTAAVESTDIEAARAARRAIGLDHRDNVSYPRAICATLGGAFAVRA